MNSRAPEDRRTIRVVLGDEQFLIREAITSMLRSVPSFEVVRVCADLWSLKAAVASEHPDVVITEIRLPPTRSDEGIQIASELRLSRPQIGVVVLSASRTVEPAHLRDLFRHGPEGRAFLLKERLQDRDELAHAVRQVAAGGSVIDPKAVELLADATSHAEHSPLAQLSAREREVLAEMATGKGNVAIAEALRLSKRSVEKHIRAIFMKLGLAQTEEVSRRVKATLIFLTEDEDAVVQTPPRHTRWPP